MHLVDLWAMRFVRTSSFVTIIMSCASFILRSKFRFIGRREICQQASVTKIIGCSSLIYWWCALGRTESREIYQNAFRVYTKNLLRAKYLLYNFLHFCRFGTVRFVGKPPLSKTIGCRSLVYHWYAMGRTESREICQNTLVCYNNNVVRYMYTMIFI